MLSYSSLQQGFTSVLVWFQTPPGIALLSYRLKRVFLLSTPTGFKPLRGSLCFPTEKARRVPRGPYFVSNPSGDRFAFLLIWLRNSTPSYTLVSNPSGDRFAFLHGRLASCLAYGCQVSNPSGDRFAFLPVFSGLTETTVFKFQTPPGIALLSYGTSEDRTTHGHQGFKPLRRRICGN